MHAFLSPLLTEESRKKASFATRQNLYFEGFSPGFFFSVWLFQDRIAPRRQYLFLATFSDRNYPNSSPEEKGTVEGWIWIKTKRLFGKGERGKKRNWESTSITFLPHLLFRSRKQGFPIKILRVEYNSDGEKGDESEKITPVSSTFLLEGC